MGHDFRKPRADWHLGVPLFICFVTALLLRVAVAFRFPSIEYADEIFNTLEPAHRLAYGYGIVVWEWVRGARTWVFPAFLAGVMRITSWMGPGSLGYLLAIAVLLSLLSLVSIWFGYVWAKRSSGSAAALIAAWGCATWYQLVYFAPKAFTEVVSTDLLLPGLYFGMYGEELPEKQRLFLSGLLLGTAVSLRIQLAPAIGFAVLYFCHRKWKMRGPAVLGGLLLAVVAFGLVDAVTWSYPFQSFFMNVWINIFEKRNTLYGIEPWYWYLLLLLKSLGPMLLLALVGVRRSPFLGWLVLLIVLSHSMVPHKELRYMYPVMPILITLAALGFVELVELFRVRSPQRTVVIAGVIFAVLTSSILAWRFPNWTQLSGGLIAMDRLSQDRSVCGVGLYRIGWGASGGYTHLHQNVPIVFVLRSADFERSTLSFNALLTSGLLPDPKVGFEVAGCWNGICLYRRAGPCLPPSQDSELNTILRKYRQ